MKTSDMMTFTNPEFGTIRTLTIDGEPWFVGKDVAEKLGYTNPNKALGDHIDIEDKLNSKTLSSSVKLNNEMLLSLGQRGGWLINESGVYSLILSSKLEGAKRFKHWVTADVLPAIRKTGGYIAGEEKMSDEELFMQALLIANRKLEQRNADYAKLEQNHQALTAEAEVMRPKAAFADAVASSEDCIPLGDLAKLLKQNGVDIGRTRLFDWLRKNGYLISQYGSSYNTPTQKAMEQKLFRVKESLYYRGSFEHVNRTTIVTGKGQQYFIRKFLGKEDKQ